MSWTHHQPVTITRPMFTIAEAAAACGVTTKTIQRRLPQLEALDAVKDEHGRWSIPYEALLGVGLQPGKPAGPDRVDSPTDAPSVSVEKVQADVRAEMDRLRHWAELLELKIAAKDEVIAAKDQTIASKDEVIAWARLQLPPGALEKPAPAIVTEPVADVTTAGLAAVVEAPKASKWRVVREFFTGK